jgi:hypothetical protein
MFNYVRHVTDVLHLAITEPLYEEGGNFLLYLTKTSKHIFYYNPVSGWLVAAAWGGVGIVVYL